MDFLTTQAFGTPYWVWFGFFLFIAALMTFDLGVLYRKAHVMGMRESARLWMFYASLAIAFGIFVNFYLGSEKAFLFFTGYVVEQSLSMDNIFVIAMILGYFAIPRELQHRVLFYGILGVVVLRGIMILAGAALIAQFHWILYVFAIFLVFTGIRMMLNGENHFDVASNPVLTFLRRHFRVTKGLRGNRFIVREAASRGGPALLHITPLLVALCVIEVADLIFAVDSIPAIFAITTDPFIVFSSNIFAILGLRALYFVLRAMLYRFAYLKYALSAVLVFIGAKILVIEGFGLDGISPAWSLLVTLAILGAGIIASLKKTAAEPAPAGIECCDPDDMLVENRSASAERRLAADTDAPAVRSRPD